MILICYNKYWYKNSLLYPHLMSVMTSIDKSSKENGCLEILEGSHKCGRIDHGFVGGQTGADVDRVELIRQVCPHKYVELDPGDAVFFHCNLLHTSQANTSPHRRWVYICCYNLKSNNSIHEHHWASYRKIDVVPDSAIMECTNETDMSGKQFADPRENKTVIVTSY
ncbi:probable phytanoyl-CoA dioxygenase [Gigantopelta aegis]|uniref:probable phytanoyl-CoA dioxygenase n=1 Tax=Gigantopelta aegis TaxID=1735272 RepID=UPI001B88A2D2|nr:probable phytanoyl-CoA dioxygenase [Gigantopelta aegis]